MPAIPNNAPTPMIADVIDAVLAFYPAMTRADLMGRSRLRKFTGPRQMAMALARELGGASLTKIGKVFGRDHTTVLHAARVIAARTASDTELEIVRVQLTNRIMDGDSLRRRVRQAIAADPMLRDKVKPELLTQARAA